MQKKTDDKLEDLVEVVVLRAIGVEYTEEELKKLRDSARREFKSAGLTKTVSSGNVMLPREVARKLQAVGAVRVVI